MASRGVKWLIGCGIGCGSLVLLCVFVLIAVGVWATRPGALIEPGALHGQDLTGYAEWKLSADDPGTEVFALAALETFQRASREHGPFPPAFKTFLGTLQQRQNEKQLRQMLPLTAVWTARPSGTPGHDTHVVVLSLARVGNRMRLFDWFLGWVLNRDRYSDVLSHGDEKIFVLRPKEQDGTRSQIVFFIRGNNLVFASDLEAARGAIDRLSGRAAPPAGQASGMDALFDGLPADAGLRAVVVNRDGQALALLELLFELTDSPLPPREPWQALTGMTLVGRLVADGSFAGTLELWCPDPAWARDHVAPIAASLQQVETEALHLELEPQAVGERIRVAFRIPDLATLPARRLSESIKDKRRKPRTRGRRRRGGTYGAASARSTIQNIDPRGETSSAPTWPPIASTRCLTMARPRPVPPTPRERPESTR